MAGDCVGGKGVGRFVERDWLRRVTSGLAATRLASTELDEAATTGSVEVPTNNSPELRQRKDFAETVIALHKLNLGCGRNQKDQTRKST